MRGGGGWRYFIVVCTVHTLCYTHLSRTSHNRRIVYLYVRIYCVEFFMAAFTSLLQDSGMQSGGDVDESSEPEGMSISYTAPSSHLT